MVFSPETSASPVDVGPLERAPGSALPIGDHNMNPPGISFPALIAEDFRTHGGDLLSPGFWAVAICRFGNWRMSVSPLLRAPLSLAYRVAHRASIWFWAIDLPYNARVGRRFRIMHHGAVFQGAWLIGDDVTLRHSATIGLIRRGADRAPTIGSRVEIGPGACIVGDVSIGDDVYIGANSVVTQDVPSGATVLGNPSRMINLANVVEKTRPAGAAP